VRIERTGDSVEVPLELETHVAPQFVSIQRTPGQPPMYTVQVGSQGHLRFSPNPERAGPTSLLLTAFDLLQDALPLETVVLTAAAGDGPTRQVSVRRLDASRFVADVELQAGRNRLAVVARTSGGTRLRAVLALDVPAR
jgi:hypothetical protein